MKRNENAISPLIGVILMVAITVILAAVVVSTFLFAAAHHIERGGDYTYNYTSETYGYCAHDGIIIPANTTRVFNYTDGRNVTINCR